MEFQEFIEKKYTLAIFNKDKVYTSYERGVKPLLKLVDEQIDVKGFIAYDKVIGKGAALLYVYLSVKEITVNVISQPALEYLNKHNIKVNYYQLVDNIINHNKDGLCPIEQLTLNEDNPQEAIIKIKQKLKEMYK